MKVVPRKNGYRVITLAYQGTTRQYGLHVLLLEAFVGPCPPGMEACHNDGDPTNNTLSNLRWDTHKSNLRDRRQHGTFPQGEQHGLAVLSESAVREIRMQCGPRRPGTRRGPVVRALAEKFGVTVQAIYLVVNGKNWAHVR